MVFILTQCATQNANYCKKIYWRFNWC